MAAGAIQNVKLIQLNLWQGKLLRKVLPFLNEEKPDIVCLQEVTSSKDIGHGFLEVNNLEQLLEDLGFPYHFFAPRFGYDLMHTKARYGNAILSRQPLLDKQSFFTHGAYDDDYVHQYRKRNISLAQHATVELKGQTVHIFNHHGYHQFDPNGNETSIESLHNLAQWTDKFSGPRILAGDLNVWPQSPALESLNQRFINLTQEHRVRSTLNEFAVADVACDYILVTEDIKVHHFEVSEKIVSDHKALILEFEV
jgi:endonuclease/exonuclease/phosphatase family metal-dependent hydrolase